MHGNLEKATAQAFRRKFNLVLFLYRQLKMIAEGGMFRPTNMISTDRE